MNPYELLYHYAAIVVRVIDGDTIVLHWSLGGEIWQHNVHFRLARINAPDARKEGPEAAHAATEYLRSLFPVGAKIFIRTIKDTQEKYGRYLIELTAEQDGQWVNVNDLLVLAGHAVYVEY
jgi:endonuclease YncB( thermonuclease family)